MKRKEFLWLLPLFMLHFFIVGLFVFNVIPQKAKDPNHAFIFHGGGDNEYYYSLARDVSALNFPKANKFPLGLPIMLAPVIRIFDPPFQNYIQIFSVFWSLIMFPLGQSLLYLLTKYLTGKNKSAVITVFLWTLMPLFYFLGMHFFPNPNIGDEAVHLTWAQMATDGPTTFFTMFVILLFLIARRKHFPNNLVVLMGIVTGFLMLVRYNSLITFIFLGLIFLVERKFRKAILFAFVSFLVFLPQLFYNWHFFNNPLTTGYTAIDILPAGGLFNLSYLLYVIGAAWRYLGLGFIAALMAGLVIFYRGVKKLYTFSKVGALIICLWLGSYSIFYGLFYYTWQGCFIFYLMPAFPAVAIILAASFIR